MVKLKIKQARSARFRKKQAQEAVHCACNANTMDEQKTGHWSSHEKKKVRRSNYQTLQTAGDRRGVQGLASLM